MAYTVTYKRRTQTGKISTVRRRVSGDKPGPSVKSRAGKVLHRAERKAGQVARSAKRTTGQVLREASKIGQTKTVVRSKTTSVKITGPKFGTGKVKNYGTGVITGPKGFNASKSAGSRPMITDKRTGQKYVWITKRVGGGKSTGKYVEVPMSGRVLRRK